MKRAFVIIFFAWIAVYIQSCDQPRTASEQTISEKSANNTELADFICKIKTVDNHTHATTIEPDDKGYDALPLEALLPFELPARIRPESPMWLAAAKAVYGFKAQELNEKTMKDLADNTSSTSHDIYKLGSFTLNASTQELANDSNRFQLSYKEVELLKRLCESKSAVVDRQVLLEELWGSDNIFNSKTMNVYMSKLRNYLNSDKTVEILTIRGHGYKLIERNK